MINQNTITTANVNTLPTSFQLSVFGRTFRMKYYPNWQQFRGYSGPYGVRLTDAQFEIFEDLEQEATGIYTKWGGGPTWYFRGLRADENYPGKKMFNPVGLNRHFDPRDGITHCDGDCCPVAW